ncbi:Uncharacterised protein [Salmonella enterica subsp. enterica serovar Bovismorbificans]|uniref:Uncharacterized protein n=1 Tax=Salmonella enterica subsp. enterica serovar Bovismorbificans TaxID=58097 RepID=A0A655ESZ4_SALET|nr:Uncharacterised protein [Salmonella enterica subsp. enterica serovar Bovismorbificans]CPR81408.1 Uncharacterised protein [Salmonella enterica subsp. enterica serovar Bovismorbificans]
MTNLFFVQHTMQGIILTDKGGSLYRYDWVLEVNSNLKKQSTIYKTPYLYPYHLHDVGSMNHYFSSLPYCQFHQYK